jgi:hypothetical protein
MQQIPSWKANNSLLVKNFPVSVPISLRSTWIFPIYMCFFQEVCFLQVFDQSLVMWFWSILCMVRVPPILSPFYLMMQTLSGDEYKLWTTCSCHYYFPASSHFWVRIFWGPWSQAPLICCSWRYLVQLLSGLSSTLTVPPPNTPGTCPLLHDFRSFVPGVHGNLLGTVTSVLVAVLLNEIAVNPCQCFAFLTFIILDALC